MRLGPSVGCGARAHSGPCPYWCIWLAVLCQGPLQAAPQGLGLGIRSPVRYPAAAGVSLRPSRPQSGQRPRLRGPSGRRLNCGPPQGQGLQQQPAAGAPARLGGAAPPARGPGPLRPPAGRGRRGGRPHSPHRVGAGPPRSTCAATGTGEEQCKARRAAPQGLGLALRRGAPVQRLRPNLTGTGPAGARPWAAHYPGQPPQGDGRGGRRHAAQGGQGCGPRPLGAGGTAQRAGREPPPPPAGGGPLPVARSSCQRWGPGVGSDAAADSGPAAECSSTGASMVAPALWNGC